MNLHYVQKVADIGLKLSLNSKFNFVFGKSQRFLANFLNFCV